MYHRYGRHGPRAWLRWYRRHYTRPATSLVPVIQPTTLVIQVPSNAERIIIIVGTPSEHFERDDTQERGVVIGDISNIQSFPGRTIDEIARLSTSKQLSPLQKIAHRRASDDLNTLERTIKSGKYIVLDLDKLVERGALLGRQSISDDYLASHSDDYDDLLKEYQEAYHQKVQEGLPVLGSHVTALQDGKERELRDILGRDRAIVQTRAPGDWHARDLVLVRILQIYYRDTLERVDSRILSELHVLIDRYEKYVLDFEARNEVTWPDQDSF